MIVLVAGAHGVTGKQVVALLKGGVLVGDPQDEAG